MSSRDDGTIDVKTDSVQRNDVNGLSNGIKYVSSIIYTTADTSSFDVYLQVDQTDYRKTDTSSYSVSYSSYPPTIKYNLPSAVILDSSTNTATITSSQQTAYIVQGSTNNLPVYLAGCNRQILHTTAESSDFMTNITTDLNKQMGSNGLAFFAKIKSCVSSKIWDKATSQAPENPTDAQRIEALQRLMPDAIYKTGKPLVEWAITITPMMGWVASRYRADSFWLFNSLAGEMNYVTPYNQSKDVMMLMDAYHSSIFDKMTTGSDATYSIWKYEAFKKAVDKAKGFIPKETIEKYWNSGILRVNYTGTNSGGQAFNILKDLGTCAYIDEPGPLLGLNDWVNQTLYDDDTIARRGGIYFAVMKMNDIPVYYYITPTPNDPITPPGTATPPTYQHVLRT